jgi:hypothetical protein
MRVVAGVRKQKSLGEERHRSGSNLEVELHRIERILHLTAGLGHTEEARRAPSRRRERDRAEGVGPTMIEPGELLEEGHPICAMRCRKISGAGRHRPRRRRACRSLSNATTPVNGVSPLLMSSFGGRTQGSLDAEAACQRFAGAFLVPAGVLSREVGRIRRTIAPRELFELKLLFGVSAQAIAYRCKDLGILSQSALTTVFKLFSARGWRAEEPIPVRKERPARFERLCIRALAEGVISDSKASGCCRRPEGCRAWTSRRRT